jgi:hypothetical protein
VDVNTDSLSLAYTNKLNAIQFVKKKSPVDVNSDPSGTKISAGNWDVAGDRNTLADETQPFGPDTFPIVDPNSSRAVGYIEPMEFMFYDVNVSNAVKGRYNLTLDVNISTNNFWMPSMNVYFDGEYVGSTKYTTGGIEGESTPVSLNLPAGIHTVGWQLPSGTNYGFNLIYLHLVRTGDISMSNCSDVGLYGYNLPADLSGNCSVALEDLALAVNNWLICNNPDPNGCF